MIGDILQRLQAGEAVTRLPSPAAVQEWLGQGRGNPLQRDAGGREFVHTRCFTRDVTTQKRAERALREAEARFKAVFNQQFQFMSILAPDGTVLEANDTCFRATGVEREQVLGRLFWQTPWWDRLPAMQEQWKSHISTAASGGGPVTGEMDYSLADGTIRHATTVVTGLKDETGQSNGCRR